jgi:hypothetical protein
MVEIFEYIEDGHIYKLDGIVIPGVTDLVRPLGEDIDEMQENAVEAAADRGVTCHKVLELLLGGETEIEYPDAYEPYVEAIRLFLSEHEIIPLSIETPICSERLRVGGTPDLLCYYDGKLAALDYKFVSQIAKSKVQAQLNGYMELLIDSGVFPEELHAVQFLNDGKYRPYPVSINNKWFVACYEIYMRKNCKHPRGRIE